MADLPAFVAPFESIEISPGGHHQNVAIGSLDRVISDEVALPRSRIAGNFDQRLANYVLCTLHGFQHRHDPINEINGRALEQPMIIGRIAMETAVHQISIATINSPR